MNRFKKAIIACLAGGVIMSVIMLVGQNDLGTILSMGFGTTIISLAGVSLGRWSKDQD